MTNDRVLLAVVAVVGLTLLGGLLGVVLLAVNGQPVPDVLQNVTIGSLTLLGGLLVPTGVKAPRQP